MEDRNKYIVHRCPSCRSAQIKDLEKEYYGFEGTGGLFKAMERMLFDSKPEHKYRCVDCGREWDHDNLVDETPLEVLESERLSRIESAKSSYLFNFIWGILLLTAAVFSFRYCWNNDFRYYETVNGWFNTGPVDVAYYHWSWLFVGIIFLVTGIWAVKLIMKSQRYRDKMKSLKAKKAEDLRRFSK